MRFALALLVAALLAPVALAQPCDPTQTDEACPDTTEARRYFPLAVGNTWHYLQPAGDEPETLWSWAVTGETEAGGQSYFELERCEAAANGSAVCEAPILIRYDPEHALVVRRDGEAETWWDETPCGLDADFHTEYTCSGPGTEAATFAVSEGAYGASVEVPPDTVRGDTRKPFDWLFVRGWEAYAGLGMTELRYELQGEPTRLVYALVFDEYEWYPRGRQFGQPAFASCDPATADPEVACPDTTNWRRYVPLAVGNRWQYFVERHIKPDYHHGTEIVGETEIEGVPYFLARYCSPEACSAPFPVRYDEEGSWVVRRRVDSEGNEIFRGFSPSNYFSTPCSLDAPFGTSENACDKFFPYLFVSGGYGVGGTRKKVSDGLQGYVEYRAGLGPIRSDNVDNQIVEDLVYARVGNTTFGTPAFEFPTAGEGGPAPPARTAFTATFPNPARGALDIAYTLAGPQAVRLDLVDLLGRRVRSAELGPQAAGPHDARIDLGGLRAGLYVLRLRGDDGAEATRRVVVVR